MKKKYLIADLLIKINGEDDAYLEKKLKPYAHQTFRKSDVVIKTVKSESFIENKFENINKISESQYFHEGEFYDSVIFYDENLCRIVALIQFDKSYTEVTITVCNLKKLCKINCDKLLFNVVGIAMHYLMRMKNGFVFHSSAIAVHEKGIAFSAQSGVGKSTHTAMWLDFVPGTVMVNDDTPILRALNSDEVYLYGSPWAGTSGANTNVRVPLDSIVFLSQSSNNSIEEISTVDAMKLFFEGVRPSATGAMHLHSLDTLGKIMKNTKMYCLKCNTDVEAVFTVKNKILK